MRAIGPHRERKEFETDPTRAFRRGRVLDAMLSAALPPIERGVRRGTAAAFDREDRARALAAARRINPG